MLGLLGPKHACIFVYMCPGTGWRGSCNNQWMIDSSSFLGLGQTPAVWLIILGLSVQIADVSEGLLPAQGQGGTYRFSWPVTWHPGPHQLVMDPIFPKDIKAWSAAVDVRPLVGGLG